MDIISIVLIGIGLAMDCFAVSMAKGVCVDLHEVFAKKQHPWIMAVLFGIFQGGMPLIGYGIGSLYSVFFERYAPYIALVLLCFIGGKMIIEGLDRRNPETNADFSIKTMLLLAVATSIDALATGVIFIPEPHFLWLGISIIAIVSFIFTIVGYLLGVFVGTKLRINTELMGGIILIGIGLKIFLEGILG